MPFKKANMDIERQELNELLESSTEAKKAHNIFNAEYNFRLMLAKERKSKSITQKKIGEQSGLTQQVISRIEKGSTDDRSPTLRTVFCYLDAIDCELVITKKRNVSSLKEKATETVPQKQ
jgi:DNA-binding XRE family transcriptional regulator